MGLIAKSISFGLSPTLIKGIYVYRRKMRLIIKKRLFRSNYHRAWCVTFADPATFPSRGGWGVPRGKFFFVVGVGLVRGLFWGNF